jgi:predicted  nucleic acid-binding Zn-ribbon protein
MIILNEIDDKLQPLLCDLDTVKDQMTAAESEIEKSQIRYSQAKAVSSACDQNLTGSRQKVMTDAELEKAIADRRKARDLVSALKIELAEKAKTVLPINKDMGRIKGEITAVLDEAIREVALTHKENIRAALMEQTEALTHVRNAINSRLVAHGVDKGHLKPIDSILGSLESSQQAFK